MHTSRGGWARTRRARRLKAATRAAAVSAVVVLLTSCGGSDSGAPTVSALEDDAITVGSFDFAESVVVAEVYSQGLEAAGFKVNRAFSLGPREFVGPALKSGLVEFVPEYAGTAAEFYSIGKAEPTDDVALTHEQLVQAVDGRFRRRARCSRRLRTPTHSS